MQELVPTTLSTNILVSADSHMAEPPDLWDKNLPQSLRDRAPRITARLFETSQHLRAGGWDPHERLKDMAFDGVSAEVLYPTLGTLDVRFPDDWGLEEACFRVYNDWLMDFCSVAPERFWGLGIVSLWNVGHAIEEMGRFKKGGLRGAAVWIAAPEELPYNSDHYEEFWAAAQDMEMPLSMHINARARPVIVNPKLPQAHSVTGHKVDAMNSLLHIIGSGVLERYPRLRIVVAEIGVGWIPFWLQELDYYTASRQPLPMLPSEYFHRQVSSTFISDAVGSYLLEAHGQDNFMWSHDYPHPASTWPESHVVVSEQLRHISKETREKVLWGNVARVYNGGKPPTPPDPPGDRAKLDVWLTSHSGFGAASRLRHAARTVR
jgi:predicted TIM-barrel fold metal-dependent hydrolase